MNKTHHFFGQYYKGNTLKISTYIFSSIVSKICLLIIPYLTKLLVDSVQNNSLEDLKKYIIILILLMVLFQIFLALKYYLGEYIDTHISSKLKSELINKTMSLPLNEVKSISNGELLQRVFNDTEVVKPLIISTKVDIVLNVIYSICICFIMFKLNVATTLILLLLFPIFLLICKYYMPKIEKVNKEVIEEDENLKTLSEETLSGNFDIRVNNASHYINKKIDNNIKKYIKASIRNIKYNMKYDYIFTTGIMNFSSILIYGLGGYLVIKKYLSIGSLLAFTLYFSKLWDPVEYFMALPKDLKVYRISLERIQEFLNLQEEDEGKITSLPNLKEIKIQNLNFYYDDKIILEDINIVINKGDKIGIRGGNGTGKSTVASILAKLNLVNIGEIYFNDINFKDINSNKLREKVVYVPANGYIFNDTVKNNITLHKDNETSFENFKLNNKLFELISKNNINLQENISNQDNKLSSGEKRIIQILRGVFLNGEVYIFDEPLNFIDYKYKELLIEFIDNNLKDKTVIIISHDDSIFRCCNRMYSLKNKKLNISTEFIAEL
ncbi:ABC-type bacteriocin/lantibiotic exporter, contains an N-terminal double-glycine peptidase domain [Clostridium collagenovorans DSM 3089]|uniref:ABC-type bacteriocin/lantibiotic exporter, contains an N-terminal double-glycine peptidase domain n=1 Tax=Clostridium collagenovorans DSM 3089 TaxID=1121306 RepID=A0A1M5WTD1_9CLOT|nr:ABC transporter transmembrane domain-containing protein [Clostridium collagenovorans]SHH90836.1 ABC-type bacteriocin/lantibiotic exporter, contains an N-terminal double-glycine peptidase domain [Clostridium collagenovorans DSM 3089]